MGPTDLLSAEQQVITLLEERLSQIQSDLAGPVNVLNQWLEDELVKGFKRVHTWRMCLGRWLGKSLNAIEATLSSLADVIDTHLWDELDRIERVLTALAVRGGKMSPSQRLHEIDWSAAAQGDGIEWGGKLVLDCTTIQPTLDALIEVLREIRDRLTPTAVQLPMEPAAIDEAAVKIAALDTFTPRGPALDLAWGNNGKK
jgi:hypothetical protein